MGHLIITFFLNQIQPRGPSDSHGAVAEVLIFLLSMAGFMKMMEQARESQELNNTLIKPEVSHDTLVLT